MKMDKIKQFVSKYEGFLLFVIADIFITVETVWFIELIHLVTVDSPASLLWQGGLGYFIMLVVSYFFIKKIKINIINDSLIC